MKTTALIGKDRVAEFKHGTFFVHDVRTLTRTELIPDEVSKIAAGLTVRDLQLTDGERSELCQFAGRMMTWRRCGGVR